MDIAILNANVVTLDAGKPKAEAFAVRDGRIVAVGSGEEIRKYIGSGTKVLDLEGKTVVPGFVDCHVHMTGFGQHMQTLDLRDVDSIGEMKWKIREYAGKHPEKGWILGGRWDHERFSERRLPTRWDLDEAVGDKPVFLIRVCGHVGVANSRALELAGIGKETVVDGGAVDMDTASGEPNGILRENALNLVWRVVPKPSMAELEEACIQACRKAVENGLTGVHWIVDSADEIRIIQKLYNEGKLPLRVYLGIPAKLLDEVLRFGLVSGFGNEMVRLGFVKILADGSLGARTAALKQPYTDKPETSGMLIYSQRRLNWLVLKAHRAGWQLAVHAIGDRAIESVLEAFSKALKRFPRKDHRHRIEHCSVLSPRLIRRMKRLGLIASVQPHFIVSDFWVVDRVGVERARWVYPFKTLLRTGVVVASGSDCPVEPINPLLGVWAAVARKSFSEESLTVEEALKTYTVNAAYASFDEARMGTISVGKFADLTVLSEDPFTVATEEIRNIRVEMTIVGGKIVYSRC
ncbi:amidohydrolase [Candidatus Bathyarchaeota archaeon]|nr:amidohydrolase [Candidatus Bathyarchaeota archaeon]